MIKIQIKKANDTITTPTHGTDFSAGYDLYSTEEYTLKPLERKLFKTGITVAIPYGMYGRIAPRSGLAYKDGLDVMAGVIDCFSETSIIKTESGNKTINDLKIDDIIYSINENMEIERDFISAIVALGEKEILIIETDDGNMEITPGTLVYTETGVKTANELKENDKILHF